MPLPWSLKKVDGVCSVCGLGLHAKGLCSRHYHMMRIYGRTDLETKQSNRSCSWDGCGKPVRACGYCKPHYVQARREGLLHAGKYIRDHPLYGMWWARKKEDVLEPEWADDFQRFAQEVGERPGKYYSLVTLREGKFGPSNFRWRAHLKRQPGETKKQFWARKWQSQKEERPGWDSDRSLRRNFGITRDDYNKILASQDCVCAICRQKETRVDHQNGLPLRLAVDHCHKSGKIRGLLCWRCNTMIGKFSESLDLLRAIEVYLLRHNPT